MGILTWTVLFILNATLAIVNYKLENYKTAMFCFSTVGMILLVFAKELIEYYA
tara:strand:+ start:346 stop:504 length:159 start_codon:yes stop_codon:yes gene_type:complete